MATLPNLKSERPTGVRSLPFMASMTVRPRLAQAVCIAHAASVARAVEEFEDVDGHLAPTANGVAQVSRA